MNIARVKQLWVISLVLWFAIFAIGMFSQDQFTQPELFMVVICFALASAVFGGVFFIGCHIFSPDLATYIVGDETKVEGPIVKTTTELSASGDAEIDRWVKRYAFARNLFGMAILPLLILVGLLLFG